MDGINQRLKFHAFSIQRKENVLELIFIYVALTQWVQDCCNAFFVLQRRKGHGTFGFSSLLVGTLDSIFDTRPPPYRILLQSPDSQVSFQVAVGLTRQDVLQNWAWLEKNLVPNLGAFDNVDDKLQYVKTKIESLINMQTREANAPESAG